MTARVSKPKPTVADDDGFNNFLSIMRRFEMKDWGLNRWQEALCLQSPVFMALMRTAEKYPKAGELMPLAPIWEAAGSPPDKAPETWVRDSWSGGPDPVGPGIVEFRGQDGVWAEWVVVCWYAESLCDRIGPEHICEMCY